MNYVDVNEADLAHLLQCVEAGEEIVIRRAGLPIARIIPHHSVAAERKPGAWRGKVTIADDFDETPNWLIASFEGRA